MRPHEGFRWWNGMLTRGKWKRKLYYSEVNDVISAWPFIYQRNFLVRQHFLPVVGGGWRVAGSGWRVAGGGWRVSKIQTAPQSSKSRFNISSYIKGRWLHELTIWIYQRWFQYQDVKSITKSISTDKKIIPVSIFKCITKRIDQTLFKYLLQGDARWTKQDTDNWQITGNPSSIYPCSGCRGCAPPPPEMKLSSLFSLLKFAGLTSQLRHSLVAHHPGSVPVLALCNNRIYGSVLRKRLYSKLQ